nr:polymer-forming cytoskeletal protein [Parvibaculum indicum]
MSIADNKSSPEKLPPEKASSDKPSSGEKHAAGAEARSANVHVLRAGNEDIVVGDNSSLEGSFDTNGSMFVDGLVRRAELRANLLSISASGRVEGEAFVQRAEIAGEFEGTLTCAGEVIMRSTGRVSGHITCGQLVTHRGAGVDAHINVTGVEELREASSGSSHGSARGAGGRRGFRPSLRWHVRQMAPIMFGVIIALGSIGLLSLMPG